MKPKISVLTTVYNGERFLKETIQSVLNSSFKDFEYIIIDDGSTDKTKEIIESFKDKRIKYFYKENEGFKNLHKAMNFGLRKCKGEYIARIDSDDLCYYTRLEVQNNYLNKHKKIFLIGSSADVIDQRGKRIGSITKKPFPSFWIKHRLGFSNPFTHSSIMFRNEGFEYIAQNEHFFYLNLLMNGKRLKNLFWFLIQYRINPFGLMAQEADLTKNKYKKFYLGEK